MYACLLLPPAPAASRVPLQWCLVFDAASPRYHTRSVLVERAHTAAVSSLSSLAVPGCSWLASASADRSVCLWNLEGRPAALGRALHPGPVLFVQLQSPETALSVCADAAYLWRIEPAAGSEAAAGGSTAGAAHAAAAVRRAEQKGRRSNMAGDAASGGDSGSHAAVYRSVPSQEERKEEGCPPAFHFRLLRRIPFGSSGCSSGGGRATCAAAWDNWLAAGCGEAKLLMFLRGVASRGVPCVPPCYCSPAASLHA
jgi:WD40 repeat protein